MMSMTWAPGSPAAPDVASTSEFLGCEHRSSTLGFVTEYIIYHLIQLPYVAYKLGAVFSTEPDDLNTIAQSVAVHTENSHSTPTVLNAAGYQQHLLTQ